MFKQNTVQRTVQDEIEQIESQNIQVIINLLIMYHGDFTKCSCIEHVKLCFIMYDNMFEHIYFSL